MLNGLQSCEQMTATPNQFGGPSVQLGDVKNVADELQRQYEKTLRCVKDFTKKSVKVFPLYVQIRCTCTLANTVADMETTCIHSAI